MRFPEKHSCFFLVYTLLNHVNNSLFPPKSFPVYCNNFSVSCNNLAVSCKTFCFLEKYSLLSWENYAIFYKSFPVFCEHFCFLLSLAFSWISLPFLIKTLPYPFYNSLFRAKTFQFFVKTFRFICSLKLDGFLSEFSIRPDIIKLSFCFYFVNRIFTI